MALLLVLASFNQSFTFLPFPISVCHFFRKTLSEGSITLLFALTIFVSNISKNLRHVRLALESNLDGNFSRVLNVIYSELEMARKSCFPSNRRKMPGQVNYIQSPFSSTIVICERTQSFPLRTSYDDKRTRLEEEVEIIVISTFQFMLLKLLFIIFAEPISLVTFHEQFFRICRYLSLISFIVFCKR